MEDFYSLEDFHTLEVSLKEFLSEAQDSGSANKSSSYYKYNNLRIFMSPKKNKIPHFVIRIGIAEAMFNIENGEKISGGLGPDERVVRRWLDRNISRVDFGSVWKTANKAEQTPLKKPGSI